MHMLAMPEPEIYYPDSDGKPMADNTKQFRWIQVLQGNLAAKFRDDANVFVAGDLLWYPVEKSGVRAAPDVLIAFGRPKGDRGSYKQWEEGDVAPQVVFEVLSPSNKPTEMMNKRDFYDEHGVEEYYLYDPDDNLLFIYTRRSVTLARVFGIEEFVSPRLQIRFDLSEDGSEMAVFHADGRRFLTFEQIEAAREREQHRADNEQHRADNEQHRADNEQQRADNEQQRADNEQQRADKAEQQRDDATRRLDRIAELTRKLLAGQANDDDKAELARLTSAAP